MRKEELLLRPNMAQQELEELIGPWAQQNEAEVKPMGRLTRSYKTEGENMHWHISGEKKGMGTVEVTYIPSTGRLTVLVHDNRRGAWAGTAYEELARDIRRVAKLSSF